MMLRFSLLITVAIGLTTHATAIRPQQPVELSKPQDGVVVFDRKLSVSGTAPVASRVVVMIQGMTKDRSWRVASLVRPEPDGTFQSDIQLSDTQYDVAYRVVAVAAVGEYALRSVRPGTTFRQPPSGLPHSDMIRVTVAGNARPGAENDSAAERILLPVNGSEVGRDETVVIEGLGDPLPVVMIRHDEKGSAWYAQPEVERVGPGRTAVKVRFGDEKAIAGQRFQIRLALPKTKRQRTAIAPGRPITTLPPAITYGRPVVVQLNPDKKPTVNFAALKFEQALGRGSQHVRLIGPSNGAHVPRRALISGLCDPSLIPVVLVRTEHDQEVWYVQPPCEISGSGFRNRVYLGKIGTPKGTRFQVVVTLVEPGELAKWKAGAAMTELPENNPISTPLLLVHNGEDE